MSDISVDGQVLEDDEKTKNRDPARQRSLLLLLLQNLITPNKHPHNSLSNCCHSLVIQINIQNHVDVSLNGCKHLKQLQNCRTSLLRLRFLSFFKVALLPNFNKIVKCEHEIIGVQ
jgi:hypothetical protein